MAGRLPDAGAADEAERWGEARVDAVEGDEVVEQVVGVVGGESPREGSPRHARGLATRDPDLGLKIGPLDDKGKVDVQAAGALHALAAASRVERADRADVGPVEQVMLDPNDRVVRNVSPAGLRV